MENDLTEEEEKVTQEFLRRVNGVRAQHRAAPLSRETAIKFVMARKFDLNRSIALYGEHEYVRLREGLTDLQPDKEPLKTELESGKFTILPRHTTEGCAVAIFTACKHVPNFTSHKTTLQGVVYQLDIALEDIRTQRSGVVFIYNMSGSKYSNFDYELSQKILSLLKGAYPARLKKVLIVTAPLWFKAPFKILRLFVREKLRDRVFMVNNMTHLPTHISPSCIPVDLGGNLEVDHSAWLAFCRQRAATARGLRDLCELASTNKHLLFAAQCGFRDNSNSQMDNNSSPNNGAMSVNNSLSSSSNELSNSNGDVSEEENSDGVDGSSSNNTNAVGRRLQAKHKPENIIMTGHGLPADDVISNTGFSSNPGSEGCVDGDMTLEEFIAYVKAKGKRGLIEEYNEIRSRPSDGTFSNSRLRANIGKDRYTDVPCYDHSAVRLSIVGDDTSSYYINANFVDGYEQSNAFICTQGPIPKTFGDFWRMVWEQKSVVIAMTTRTIEKGRVKCGQYWPAENQETKNFGNYNICTASVDKNPDCIVTTMIITDTLTKESRKIFHLLYTSWPDYGVPSSACSMLDFRDKVREKQTEGTALLKDWTGHSMGPPIVVHCSAGIGRTGSFITLDISINRLVATGKINIRKTVEKIRSQRAFSIQVVDQYIFCYLALVEYALTRGLLQGIDATGLESESDLE